MSYPPQQPGGWSDPSWPSPQSGSPYDPDAAPGTGGQPGIGGQPASGGQPAGGGQPVSGGQPADPYGGATPYGGAAPYGGYGYPGYGPPMAAPAQTTNGLAIASLVCALAGLVTCISAPVGAILGHVARRQIRERGEAGDGMALAGIIVGWILTALGVIGCGIYVAFIGWVVSQDGPSPGGGTFDNLIGLLRGVLT